MSRQIDRKWVMVNGFAGRWVDEYMSESMGS